MNPLTNVKNIEKLSKTELERGIPIEKSWHQQYRDSAWIFIGGLNYDLTEGDIICVFSQYGEIVNINLIRDHKSGKSKGYGFLCYEDQRSTILAVDNINGIKLASRIIRVDHVEEYKVPKMKENLDIERKKLFIEGCAPELIHPVRREQQHHPLPLLPPTHVKIEDVKTEYSSSSKKKKKEKKSKKKRKRHSTPSSDSDSSSSDNDNKTKKHKKKKKRDN